MDLRLSALGSLEQKIKLAFLSPQGIHFLSASLAPKRALFLLYYPQLKASLHLFIFSVTSLPLQPTHFPRGAKTKIHLLATSAASSSATNPLIRCHRELHFKTLYLSRSNLTGFVTVFCLKFSCIDFSYRISSSLVQVVN